jgi:SNF2 family DNA or RNA helicase
MLDLIGDVLTKENFSFVRLDGTQQQSDRERVLRDFKKPGIDIILISLRAGKYFIIHKNMIISKKYKIYLAI